MKSNGTEGREAKTLITFKLNNPSIVLASLGPLHDALLTPGDDWTRVICSWFLQAPWAPLPAMGILKSRQADLKAVFTALPIPTAMLLVYTATAEIPRIVWYAKWHDFQLLETQCILFELQGRLQKCSHSGLHFPWKLKRAENQRKHFKVHDLFRSSAVSACDCCRPTGHRVRVWEQEEVGLRNTPQFPCKCCWPPDLWHLYLTRFNFPSMVHK